MGKRHSLKLPAVSRVAKAFGADAGTDVICTKIFIRNCIPSLWRPRIICQDLWQDVPGQDYGQIQHGIWLENFPHWIDDANDWKHHRHVSIQVGRTLTRKLVQLGARVREMGGRSTVRPPHIWAWSYSYQIADFKGVFTFWISPLGQRKALLIGSLTEFRHVGA